ncbi:hypothetical protein KUTeg_008441 [Tegillarca granosa]|uniref:Poly [ADP-ribose] polymerase n=1 Tax=Tegillarca granosa TaxID=220873 RepID=A0ABQ9F974_TEGGR|nr:hypothetical protein KUTeg_008441 [Tegillarca granosa]
MTTWDDPDGFPEPYDGEDEFDDVEPCTSPKALCRVKFPYNALNDGDLVISAKSEGGWTLVYQKNPASDSQQTGEWVPSTYLTEVRPKERRPKTKIDNMGIVNTNIIKVSNLPEGTTKQEITKYFENKRKHFVGKIIGIDLNESGTTATITFKDNKSVERVMRKLPLKFGANDTQIHVELIPIDDSSSSDSEDSDEINLINCTIEVRNLPETATEGSLQIHFMSSKRSGGGEVESCIINKQEGYAKVTFENEDDMNRVLQRKQVFEGQELSLKLFEPAPPAECYKNKFFVSGLETNFDPKMLKLLFKVNAGLRATVTDILEGEEDGTALVTCDSDVDIPRLQTAFESDKEHCYKIQQVPITCTIEVRNASQRITEDTLKFYFMIEKESGGGDIENIHEHEGVFYIRFQDPLCVERTCDTKRRHKLGGEFLQVTAFYECLHGHGDFVMPKSIEIPDVDPSKIEFLKRTEQQMMKDLNENHMKIVWPEEEENDTVRIDCLIKSTQRGYKKLAKQWEKNSRKVFQMYLDQVTIETNDNVSPEVWDAVLSDIQSLNGAASDTYIIVTDETDRHINIVGHKDTVSDVSKQIRKIIREKELEHEKKEDDISETMNIESFKIELFEKLGHVEELKESFPNLKINVLQKQIDFEGPFSKINAAKLFVHQKLSNIKPAEVGRYSQSFMNFVQRDSVREYLAEKLMSQNIIAVLDFDSKKRLMVYSTTDSKAVDAAHLIKEALIETDSRQVPENSDCLLSSEELKSKIIELNQQFPGLLETSPDFQDCSIQIFCVQDNVGSVLEVINEYLTNNILLEQARKKPRGILRYLNDYRINDIRKLQEELKNHFVDIEIDETAIYIRGTATGLATSKLMMERMIRKIFKKKQVFKNSAIISQIGTTQGYEKIVSVEEATGCIIEIATEDDDEEEQDEEEETSPSPKIWAHCKTPSDKNIYCTHGDITRSENVDVIVNAADSHLKMEGGLAKVIKEKGGREVVEDCKKHIASKGRLCEGDVYCGPPGNLRDQCKSIFHAVGPIYRDGKQREEDYLREVMFQILEQAASKRYRSIVVPAISTGIYNYPLTEAVKVLVETVAEYFDDNSNSTVSDVYFCDIDFDVVTRFGHQLNETFGAGTVIFNKQQNKLGGWLDFSKGREPKAERPVVSAVFNGTVTVQIVRGNIALQKVDVIVNITSKDLDLEFDPAKLGLLDKGGKDLQRQCQAQYPDGIEEIAITRGGNLLCKNIFHCFIHQDKSPTVAINDFVETCVTVAHDERFESIAIPSISTGKLQFSAEETAKGMVAFFHKFAQEHSTSTLKDIRVVIPETSIDQIQVYEESLKEYEASLSRKSDSRRHRTFLGDQQDSDFQRKPLITRPKPIPRSTRNCFTIQNMNLEVNKGELPSAKADALVYLHIRKSSIEGADSSSFKEKAGDDVSREILAKLSDSSDKKSFPVIKAGDKIPAKFIIVVNAFTSGRDMKAILLKTMQSAEERGCESIALSGYWKSDQRKDMQDAINKLYDAIVEFQLTESSFLKSIQLVIQHQQSFTSLIPIVKDTVDTRKGKKSGLISKVTSFFGSNGQQRSNMNRSAATAASGGLDFPTQTQPQTVTTVFYGDSKQKIDGAIEELIERFQSDLKVELFEEDIIKEFSNYQINQIQGLDTPYSVEIKIEKRIGRIRVTGMPENVANATDNINRMLRSFANSTYKEREAKQLQQVVQWCYEEDDDEQEYDMWVNRELENSYLCKERQKKLRFDKGEEYVFDFEEMVEYPVNDPKKIVRIIRRDARKANGSGNEECDSLGDWLNIQRIQNKMMYRQYVAKKDQMRKDNKNCRKNERQLWHGTSEEALSTQDTYSPPSITTGYKYVYLCNVLTGEFKKGATGMRVPPAKSDTEDCLYDSVVDNEEQPSIFVIFNDTQAYPAYLVTFS